MEIDRYLVKECLGPISWMLKPLLFIVIAIFVLCLPLGDPQVKCARSEKVVLQRHRNTLLCDLYLLSVRSSQRMLEFLEFIVTLIIDILYEAKLKFYTFLEKLDGEDLCRSVCCYSNDRDHEEHVPKKEPRHRTCKCIKSRCSRTKSRQNML